MAKFCIEPQRVEPIYSGKFLCLLYSWRLNFLSFVYVIVTTNSGIVAPDGGLSVDWEFDVLMGDEVEAVWLPMSLI